MENQPNLYPKIKISTALDRFGGGWGSQTKLAIPLGVTRACISRLVRAGEKYLPENLAHRYVRLFGPEDEE